MKIRILAVIALCFGLSACASYSQVSAPQHPAPSTCETTAATPSFFYTGGYTLCWDDKRQPIGMTGGVGTSRADLVGKAVGAGGTVGGAAILADHIPSSFKITP